MNSHNIIITVIPTFIVLALFWLVLIYPNSVKERKEKEKALAAKEGDRIVTRGGIEGQVLEVKKDTVLLESGKAVLEVRRDHIREII